MSENKFITAFVAMSPDADPGKHRCVIETSVQRLYSVLVRDERQAGEVCAELVRKEGVCSIILCPGFTNQAVGRLSEALGKDVAVNVARGDGPSGAVAHRAMERAGILRH